MGAAINDASTDSVVVGALFIVAPIVCRDLRPTEQNKSLSLELSILTFFLFNICYLVYLNIYIWKTFVKMLIVHDDKK